MNQNKLDAYRIAHECSPRHIQSVIEDLIKTVNSQEDLAHKVLALNPRSTEIGAGMLANLQYLAGKIINKKGNQ